MCTGQCKADGGKCSSYTGGLVSSGQLLYPQRTPACSVPLKLSYVSQTLGTGREHQFLNHFIHGLLPHDPIHFSLLASALHDPHLQQVLIVGVSQGPQAQSGCGKAPTLWVQVQRHQPLRVSMTRARFRLTWLICQGVQAGVSNPSIGVKEDAS